MTVFENLVAAASFGSQQRERDTYDRAVEILRATGLLSIEYVLAFDSRL